MTGAGRVAPSWRDWLPIFGAMGFGLTIGALFFGLAWLVLSIPASGDAAVRAKCDQVVGMLLESRDPVELQRADMVIRHLDCDVRRRLQSLEGRG